ncbi:hypothetical protein H671_2g5705 [Cricetulus griseus]|nr:hypothetical protein H671_2g5705 [Cricetulus griseus]
MTKPMTEPGPGNGSLSGNISIGHDKDPFQVFRYVLLLALDSNPMSCEIWKKRMSDPYGFLITTQAD